MKIFIVDDDVEQRMIMADHLAKAGDAVHEFGDGNALLAGMGAAPDLILLDVEMPGLDGIATCRALRELGHDQVQVLFVSAHDDLETRLAAYAAGGSDFVVKPFVPAELIARVEVARSLQTRHASFASDIQLARQTAFTAMSSMGELGVVLEFLRVSFSCNDLDAMAAALIAALAQYGLAGTLELRAGEMRNAYSSRGTCSPLERSVLAHAQTMERVFCFGSQMAVNYPHVSFVILNLPADQDRVGRLRDHLALLGEGADARMLALTSERQRSAQSRAIVEHTTTLKHVLESIDRQQTDVRMRLLLIGSEYLNELTQAFVGLGLSERQEILLYDMAQRANARTSAAIDDGNDVAAELRQAVSRLSQLV